MKMRKVLRKKIVVKDRFDEYEKNDTAQENDVPGR
jgi:hypothetical protein